MGNKVFVTGIHTDAGKTVVSAILTEAWKTDYWKPIQAGTGSIQDHEQVKCWISPDTGVVHPPSIVLQTAASPHFAAAKENVEITIGSISFPQTENNLLIEGAGGLMVPLNKTQLVIDMISTWKTPTILVVRNYLGAINHTLLSVELLRNRDIHIAGLIFSGGDRNENIDFITQYTGLRVLGHVPEMELISKERISEEAAKFAHLKSVVF